MDDLRVGSSSFYDPGHDEAAGGKPRRRARRRAVEDGSPEEDQVLLSGEPEADEGPGGDYYVPHRADDPE